MLIGCLLLWGVGFAMDQCEQREEGVPPPASTLCREHESQTKAQRPKLWLKSHSAGPEHEPSSVSVKSDSSYQELINYKEHWSSKSSKRRKKLWYKSYSAGSKPEPMSASNKHHIRPKKKPLFKKQVRQQGGPESPGPGADPEPSWVSESLNSERVMNIYTPISQMPFSDKTPNKKQTFNPCVTTCQTVTTSGSIIRKTNFKGSTDEQQQSLKVPHHQPDSGYQTALQDIFMQLEENIMRFVKTELKRFQEVLNPDYRDGGLDQSEGEGLGGTAEEQKSSRQSFLKITQHFLRRMKQEELANCLQTRTHAAECQRTLKVHLQKNIQCVFEGITKAGNPNFFNQIYTELYITEGGTAEVNDEHEARQIERGETASFCLHLDNHKTCSSQVFTQIFKEERGLYQNKVFCFIHLSVQEFLAALHVHLTFINSGVDLLEEEQTSSLLSKVRPKSKLKHLQSAVDKALKSPNGHLDLFLRFLLGLSLQTNQSLLQGLLTQTGSCSETNQETVQYIKKKLRKKLPAGKCINLFHCLNELNDRSLVEEIQQSLISGSLSKDELSPSQWSALVFILLSSEDQDVYDQKKYSATEEALLRLLPVVKTNKSQHVDRSLEHPKQPKRVDQSTEQVLRFALQKYFCELELDPNTAHRNLKLSDNNRRVTHVRAVQPYPDHPDRFEYWNQLLCKHELTGRCYWEIEWRGVVDVAVTYGQIRRRGDGDDCKLGSNDQSWSLNCCEDGYRACHNNFRKDVDLALPSSSSVSNRVAVYVDCPAGTLSFYRVSSDKLVHLHTFNTTFTEPLYPGFEVWYGSSVSLCSV
ncbi:uncharacterized protein LOC109194752 [Oreochromis niloticus]|uniref:uncharacterized protein LOC109194752 n=1 Tax=Oreochromis niloticus TaxID=8128 RepID=UPI000DF19392|nr:uncharacterized protein LOC109194752 [Oreochromis niloticus]